MQRSIRAGSVIVALIIGSVAGLAVASRPDARFDRRSRPYQPPGA